ncbi:MAG: hypothetical protein WC297_01700 [Candidatus Paceibacterota bacterium]
MIQDSRSKIQEGGQLLIEAAVAISIFTVGVLGMVNLLNRSLGLNVVVTSQYIGSNLAMEGVEIVKNLIDSNIMGGRPWNEGMANTGEYEVEYNTMSLTAYSARKIKIDSATGLYNYSTGKDTNFTRKIQIQNICNPDCDEIKVNSIVSWKIKGGSHEINAEDHFFNWRKINPAP